MSEIQIWVDEDNYQVFTYRELAGLRDGFIWERVPIPWPQVKQIIETSAQPALSLIYWVQQWQEDE